MSARCHVNGFALLTVVSVLSALSVIALTLWRNVSTAVELARLATDRKRYLEAVHLCAQVVAREVHENYTYYRKASLHGPTVYNVSPIFAHCIQFTKKVYDPTGFMVQAKIISHTSGLLVECSLKNENMSIARARRIIVSQKE